MLMKDIVLKRKVPVATITLICVSFIGVFQLFMLIGGYGLDASVVKKTAPWFYDSFRKFVGEHPSTRPVSVDSTAADNRKSTIEAVAGINPEELSVTLDEPDAGDIKPIEVVSPVIPVSEPVKKDPLDSDEPVG